MSLLSKWYKKFTLLSIVSGIKSKSFESDIYSSAKIFFTICEGFLKLFIEVILNCLVFTLCIMILMIEVGSWWQFLLWIVCPLTLFETTLLTFHSWNLFLSYSPSFLLFAWAIVQNRRYDFCVSAHEVFLSPYPIFDSNTSFRVCIRAFNVDGTQVTKVINIVCQRIFKWVALRIGQ